MHIGENMTIGKAKSDFSSTSDESFTRCLCTLKLIVHNFGLGSEFQLRLQHPSCNCRHLLDTSS